MEIRLTTKTTPGRPRLAVALMAGLLAGTLALVWAVSAHKRERPIELAEPLAVRGLPLLIAPPAGWPAQRGFPPAPGLLAVFADSSADGRVLRVYRLTGQPMDPATLLSRFQQLERVYSLQPRGPGRVGPLPGRQAVALTRDQDPAQPRKQVPPRVHLLRVAVLGRNDYALFELSCVGPPLPWESRLMDRVAEAVQADPDAYLTIDQLAEQTGLELAGDANAGVTGSDGAGRSGGWLASAVGGDASELRLLPRASAADFWGMVTVNLAEVGPDVDLRQLLAATVNRAARPEGGGLAVPGLGLLLPRGSSPRWASEKRAIGPVSAWRARGVDGRLVRLVYVFRPLARIEPGESGETPPGPAGAAPAPAVVPDRAIRLRAWVAAEDEPAAVAAIEQLVPALRVR